MDSAAVNTIKCTSSESLLKQIHPKPTETPSPPRAPVLTTPAPWLRTALMKDMMAVLRLTSSRYRPVLLSKSLISVC